MNNPENVPISVEDEIKWILDYQVRTGASWAAIAKESGIPYGTLTLVKTGKYQGRMDKQAQLIFKFRQRIESRNERSKSALAVPKYIATPSGRKIESLLAWAHEGRITVAATGPGIGKTMTARHYRSSVSNCWIVTLRKSTSTVGAMVPSVMTAMGLSSQSGWTRQRSSQIIDYVRDRNGLLIVDEANHASLDALEEMRAWHDETGLGIALLGNEELLMRIKGGDESHKYSRLNSRIAFGHIQDVPLLGDVDEFLDAFEIDDGQIRKRMIDVALNPHNGGLREVKQILETANMLAIGEDKAIELEHVLDSMNSRLTVQKRRAA